MREVCVGRQPIFDRKRNVAGWELLFRSAGGRRVETVDGNFATANTLLTAVVEIGLQCIAESEPVFINCTREFLEASPMLPPSSCVLEVLEGIEPDASLLASLDRLREEGYLIALDDFVYTPDLASLVTRADIVKLDVLALGMTAVVEQVAALRPFGVKLLAEKVETAEELRECVAMGFDLFQGYYLRRPDTLSRRTVTVGYASALTLADECRKENADIRKITKLLSSDATLSFKMLQLANSALFNSRRPIESIPQAIAVIGFDALSRWSMLLVLSGIENCPASYLERAVERGRMCELLARLSHRNEESAYLTGLLSILDSALEAPIAQITPQLPVTDEIKDALVSRSGSLGALLDAVLAYESTTAETGSEFPLHVLERCFWEAAAYAKATTGRLQASGPTPALAGGRPSQSGLVRS